MIDPVDTPHEDTNDEAEPRILPNTALPFGASTIGANSAVLPGIPVGVAGTVEQEGRPSDDTDEIWHYRTKSEVDAEVGIHQAPESWTREGALPEADRAPVDSVEKPHDTRGLLEKIADAVTGDKTDDKTGQRID